MPHTNRKKKPSTARTNKPTIVHTKRQEILDDEGWTHVVDTPRKRSSTLTKSANGGLHTGDFEINGAGYVQRTAEEMEKECAFWRKGWEESASYKRLGSLLRGEVDVEESKDEEEIVEEVEDSAEVEVEAEMTQEVEADSVQPEQETESKSAESPEHSSAEVPVLEKKDGEDTTEKASETVEENKTEEPPVEEETAPVVEGPPTQRRKVNNIIVLGLGSLQSARREGRRATLTQLAALQTIVQYLGMSLRPNTPAMLINISRIRS